MALPKTPGAGERVKSPDCRRLQKAGSSTDENNLSKSSSANSLDGSSGNAMVTSEGVTYLHFADAFTTKNDFTLSAALHVGTTLGSVISIVISLPEGGPGGSGSGDDGETARQTEPVVVSPSGSLFRQRGKVLAMCFLDSSAGCLLSRGRPAENVKVPAKGGPGQSPPAAAGAGAASMSGVTAQDSQDKSSPPPTSAASSSTSGDQEVMAVCTDKTATVYALPSQRQVSSQTIDDSSSGSVVRAAFVNFGGSRHSPALVCYTSCGFVKVFGLPSLRPLFESYFVARCDRVDATLAFADYGHGLYFCNQNELQKFTLSRDFYRQLPEMQGSVFQVGDDVYIPNNNCSGACN